MLQRACVRLDGLTADTTALEVVEFMQCCGPAVNVYVHADPDSVTGYYALIEFKYEKSVEVAELLSGTSFRGHEVSITPLDRGAHRANTAFLQALRPKRESNTIHGNRCGKYGVLR
ncbi:hypothetical protein TcCL_ESM04290 [Trypanosoma cruzi]|nr:hypothetical protein TcCL_ESM04290 [Trypanosoma cruzi]